MATQPGRSIYNTFSIDADYVDFNGQPGSGDDIHLKAHTGSKLILESDTQVPEGKKFLVSQDLRDAQYPQHQFLLLLY